MTSPTARRILMHGPTSGPPGCGPATADALLWRNSFRRLFNAKIKKYGLKLSRRGRPDQGAGRPPDPPRLDRPLEPQPGAVPGRRKAGGHHLFVYAADNAGRRDRRCCWSVSIRSTRKSGRRLAISGPIPRTPACSPIQKMRPSRSPKSALRKGSVPTNAPRTSAICPTCPSRCCRLVSSRCRSRLRYRPTARIGSSPSRNRTSPAHSVRCSTALPATPISTRRLVPPTYKRRQAFQVARKRKEASPRTAEQRGDRRVPGLARARAPSREGRHRRRARGDRGAGTARAIVPRDEGPRQARVVPARGARCCHGAPVIDLASA